MRICLFILLLFGASVSFCQSTIPQLVLKHVNELRDSLNLSELGLDPILNEAADDHSYYMAVNKYLGHFQKTFSKETPAERVLYFGGNRTYTGENCAKVPELLNASKSLDNSRMAKQLFDSWVNSPPHYANLIHPEFTRMGLSLKKSYNKFYYSAQVFSSNEITIPKKLRIPDVAYGVRPSEKNCKDELHTYETMYFANSVIQEGNEIYFFFHDKEFFDHVIESDNDGLAIDIVLREQFPCNKENQLHVSNIFDGEMQQPIYRNDLRRKNVANNPQKVKVKIGEVPPHLLNEQWSPNVIVINDNTLCDYTWPIYLESDIYPLLELKPYYEDSNDEPLIRGLDSVHIKDEFHIPLAFERNKGEFIPLDLNSFNLIQRYGNLFSSIEVDCFSSVEGSKWRNLDLLYERENAIRELLMNSGFNPDSIKIESKENWDLMAKQIDVHDLQELKNNSELSIKKYLKQRKSDFLDSLLFEQRKSHIRAKVDSTVFIDSFDKYHLASLYQDSLSMDSINWNKVLKDEYIIPEKQLDYELWFSLAKDSTIRTNFFGAMSGLQSKYRIDSTLVSNFEFQSNSEKCAFNYAHFITQYWFDNHVGYETDGIADPITPQELLAMVDSISPKEISEISLNRLRINILLSGIHYYTSYNQWMFVDSYFDQIVALVSESGLNEQEAYELGLFCNHFHRSKQCVNLLKPFFERESLTENGYFLLAQTSAILVNEIGEDDFWRYMQMAKKQNKSRYCEWLDTFFQVQRIESIKEDFCNSCN